MPEPPSTRIGCRRPSQELKSPTTLTARAAGAHTANEVPATPSMLGRMGAEPLVELLVATLADEVQIELAERRQERVRIAQSEAPAAGVGDVELRSAAAASRP